MTELVNSIVIDGTEEVVRMGAGGGGPAVRYLVLLNGKKCWLQGCPFRYLARLAKARLNGSDGWIDKEDIEPGLNQARYIGRLKAQLREVGFDLEIENNKAGKYRLAVSEISLNFSQISKHPDYGVREIVEQLGVLNAGILS